MSPPLPHLGRGAQDAWEHTPGPGYLGPGLHHVQGMDYPSLFSGLCDVYLDRLERGVFGQVRLERRLVYVQGAVAVPGVSGENDIPDIEAPQFQPYRFTHGDLTPAQVPETRTGW